MKFFRRFSFAIAVCAALVLSSCIDYVQSVSYKDGAYHLYYKVTLSKALFAMADSDPDDVFGGFDEGLLDDLPPDAMLKKVDTDLETGMEFSFRIDPRAAGADEAQFLPTVSGARVYVPFLLGGRNDFSDELNMDDEYGITMGVLSSAKCRVLVGKSVLPAVGRAYFEGAGGGAPYEIPCYDYGDSFCFEIPFVILLGGEHRTDKIVVEQR